MHIAENTEVICFAVVATIEVSSGIGYVAYFPSSKQASVVDRNLITFDDDLPVF
jgi:hypothetical protein